jgi:hypothetical protein
MPEKNLENELERLQSVIQNATEELTQLLKDWKVLKDNDRRKIIIEVVGRVLLS